MQKWEYLYIHRFRDLVNDKWQNILQSPEGEIAFPYKDMSDALAQLGEQGWELAGVNSLSLNPAYPGVTTREVLYFKRPKN
jgi:hypothetical protein